MPRNVYAWPPVDAVGTIWETRQPINRSQSFFTGKDFSTTADRKRIGATVLVPGIGCLAGTMNGGYCEILKDLLEGGKNLIRMNSMPVNWYFDEVEIEAGLKPDVLNWTDAATPMTWTDAGTEMVWLTSPALSGTTGISGGFNYVDVSGLPPSTLIARPGEYITGYSEDNLSDGTAEPVRVLRPAYSDASGDCRIFLTAALTDTFHVEINSKKSSVFMVEGQLPSALQPVDGNWTYTWNLREVFSDEVDGFTEINPWT